MTYEEEIQAQCCSVCDLTPSCENCVKFGKKQFTEGERIGYEKGINEGLTINNVDEAYEKGLTAGGKIGRIDGEAQGRAEVVAEIKEYPWNGLSDNEIKLIGKIISRLSVGKGEQQNG